MEILEQAISYMQQHLENMSAIKYVEGAVDRIWYDKESCEWMIEFNNPFAAGEQIYMGDFLQAIHYLTP